MPTVIQQLSVLFHPSLLAAVAMLVRALLYALTLAVFAVDCSCVSIKMARSDWTAYAPFNGNKLSNFLLLLFFITEKLELVRFQPSLISDANNKVFQSYVIITFALCIS